MTTQSQAHAIAADRAQIEAEIEGGTLLTAYAETVAERPELVAHRWRGEDGTWHELTYEQVREKVRDLALGLAVSGLEPGDFVVIWSRNRSEATIADYAVMHAGGVPVFLYPTLAPEQAAYIAGHCGATVAIAENEATLARLGPAASQFRLTMVIDGTADGAASWDDVLARGRAEADRFPQKFDDLWRKVAPDDLVTLIYTSGTTGTPKAVMIKHRNTRYYNAAVRRVLPPDERADDEGIRLVSYLPMAHVTGRSVDHWAPMSEPATVVYCPDHLRLFEVAAQARPTVLVGIPRVWEKLYAALRAAVPDPVPPGAGKEVLALAGLDACRLATTGAAPIDPAIVTFFRDLGLPLTEGWGMSELSNAATIADPDHARPGTVGRAFPGIEIQIADDGEILVRGPLVMAGYYKDPERTAETIDSDGWLHTGDIGSRDEDGFLRITDRKKELIITSGGKNISPALIEYELQRHPLIGQACALGDRRNYITALLVLDPDAAPAWAKAHDIEAASMADLAAHPEVLAEVERGVAEANSHLARVEQVRRWKLLSAEWTSESGELTPTLKRRRRVITDRYAAEIEDLYA
jgi:long-chain acyl-CoA synthetase